MRLRPSRTKEELLLLAVSAGAAGVVVWALVRDVPPSPALRAATLAAVVLSLVAAFAFWFAGVARRALAEAVRSEQDAARALLSALPEGLLVVEQGRILSVNRRLCDLLGLGRGELLGATVPFPFWPPEHRHEIERWHASLEERGSHTGTLVFLAGGGRRARVVVAGATVGDREDTRHVLVVRDVSDTYRHGKRLEDLATHDPVTALLNERGFESRLRDATRRALAGGSQLSVACLDLGGAVLESPEGLLAIDRLRRLVRAGEDIGRTRDDAVAWLLPDTGAVGAVAAVDRIRLELDELDGVVVTAGVCDLAEAGDALALFALADRALVAARRQGTGSTVRHSTGPRTLVAVDPPRDGWEDEPTRVMHG
jgi:PAS domain S-box-containing protein